MREELRRGSVRETRTERRTTGEGKMLAGDGGGLPGSFFSS